MKILLIEDEKSLSDSILSYLREEGHTCELASDFASAGMKADIYGYDCVVVDITLPGGSGLEYQVRIEWTPTTKEPIPKFDGVFHVQWDEEYGRCRLVLEGSYEPPLGFVGKAFDAAVGHKIAEDTAKSLLEQLRSNIESARAKEMDKG